MNRRTLGAIVLIPGLLLPLLARADEVLDRVVVRNRLYSVAGRAELSPAVGMSIVDRLTSHVMLGAWAALNLEEALAVEGRATYALSRHTGLAESISSRFLTRDPEQGLQRVDDLAGLWELRWNALGGFRWAPVYGKVSLLSELPVHFQAYLWLGAGVGGLHRESVVYCLSVISREEGRCGSWLTEDRVSPLLGGALGLRFFTGQRGSVRLEIRDYAFPDVYRVGIDRLAAESGDGTSGTPVRAPILMHVVTLDVGYAFIF